MTKPMHPIALFRLTVLGPLASRGQIKRGEIKKIINELASQSYNIPNSRRTHLSAETIMNWYHKWKKNGIEALMPKLRLDKGGTKLSKEVQEALLLAKKNNSSRSIKTIIAILEHQGLIAKNTLSKASVHRFLKQQKISKIILPDVATIERRAFVANHAGDIWHGDVMHGPSIQTSEGMKKTYLISLLDDASRLIAHSEFCFGETALDIEVALKQAILKRGIPYKIILDNGPGYRSATLQSICAKLEIKLIYCRPYEPEGKGKLERFHRTFRSQFLNELNLEQIIGIKELNSRLWAWIEQIYHRRLHEGLDNKTPLDRWQEDLIHVRALGVKAALIDELFYHRYSRIVRKDGTVSWEGKIFEVNFELVGEKIELVVDPQNKVTIRVESSSGKDLGPATPLDRKANLYRKRQRPHTSPYKDYQKSNFIEMVHDNYQQLFKLPENFKFNNED
jgi:putative transposase